MAEVCYINVRGGEDINIKLWEYKGYILIDARH